MCSRFVRRETGFGGGRRFCFTPERLRSFVRNAFERVARDPGLPPAQITSALISYRLHRNALEIMHMITSLPSDPIDSDYR